MISGHFARTASLKYLLSFITGLWLAWPSSSFLLSMCRTWASILSQVVQKMLRILACIIICISHGFWVPGLSYRDRMYCLMQVLIPSRDPFPSLCLSALSFVLVLFLRAHLPMMAPCESANTYLSDFIHSELWYETWNCYISSGRIPFSWQSSHFLDEYVRFQKSLNGSDAGMENKRNQLLHPLAEKSDSPPKIGIACKTRR